MIWAHMLHEGDPVWSPDPQMALQALPGAAPWHRSESSSWAQPGVEHKQKQIK